MLREISHMPVTMDRKDTSLTVAEPLGILEAGRKKTRYFSYPPAVSSQAATPPARTALRSVRSHNSASDRSLRVCDAQPS